MLLKSEQELKDELEDLSPYFTKTFHIQRILNPGLFAIYLIYNNAYNSYMDIKYHIYKRDK